MKRQDKNWGRSVCLCVHVRACVFLTHMYKGNKKGRSASYQIPRASGQSRAIPAAVNNGDTGLSNRKWS